MLIRSIDHRWKRSTSRSGKPEDARDDANRERERQLANEVGAAERRERVDELVDDASHERLLPAREQLRPERGRDERAVRTVLGLVHRDHRVVEHRAHDLAEEPRRVRLVIAQHGDHLVVAQDADVGIVGRRRLAADVERQRPLGLDRAPAAGGGEVRVRVLVTRPVAGWPADAKGSVESDIPMSI